MAANAEDHSRRVVAMATRVRASICLVFNLRPFVMEDGLAFDLSRLQPMP